MMFKFHLYLASTNAFLLLLLDLLLEKPALSEDWSLSSVLSIDLWFLELDFLLPEFLDPESDLPFLLFYGGGDG